MSLTNEGIHVDMEGGKRFQDSFDAIAALKESSKSYTNLKARRMSTFCELQMAREYYAIGDFTSAKVLLDNAAGLYRREGWASLLWGVLGHLRECTRKSGLVKEFVEYSLEMASLPILSGPEGLPLNSRENGLDGHATLPLKESIHREIFRLISGDAEATSSDEDPLKIEIDLFSPLRLVLHVSVAFHEQIIRPGTPTLITLLLVTRLPLAVDISQLEVKFNQSECNFIILNSLGLPSDASSNLPCCSRVETVHSLTLLTNRWLPLTYTIKSEQSGKLECLCVVAKLGSHLEVSCRPTMGAPMDGTSICKFENHVDSLPLKDSAVLAFSCGAAAQIDEPEPQVDLAVGGSGGPALVGEHFTVPIMVASTGHAVFSGELKINLVDVRGDEPFRMSEVELVSIGCSHVELMGMAVGREENGTRISQVQALSGLASIPVLREGETFSCSLEVKFFEAKPILLLATLGYFLGTNELNSPKVHVQKSLRIESQEPMLVSHHFTSPFRLHPLLLSGSNQMVSLPLHQPTMVIVCAKNCCQVPLKLQSISVEEDNGSMEVRPVVQHHGRGGGTSSSPSPSSSSSSSSWCDSPLAPGEELKKVFTIVPNLEASKVKLGFVRLRWKRDSGDGDDGWILSDHRLPEVKVEVSPLMVCLDCPPYAILGDAFAFSVEIQNQTGLLQEVTFALGDAQNFVISGSPSGAILVPPGSTHKLVYQAVPLASGFQLLPQVAITCARYSASIEPSSQASTIFVFPSKPNLQAR